METPSIQNVLKSQRTSFQDDKERQMIENQDESKLLLNENSLYRNIPIAAMPIKMQEALRAFHLNSSIFKLTINDVILYHQNGLAIFSALQQKGAEFSDLFKFPKSIKQIFYTIKNICYNSSPLISFKTFYTINQPVLQVFNTLFNYQFYPYWNPAVPKVHTLHNFHQGNTNLTERLLRPSSDYKSDRKVYLLSTPITILSGKQCFYIIETSIPYEQAGSFTSQNLVPQVKIPISVIEIREDSKERTRISHYMQLDANLPFYKSELKYSQSYGLQYLKTMYNALGSELNDTPYYHGKEEGVSRIKQIINKQTQGVLGYALVSDMQGRVNYPNFVSLSQNTGNLNNSLGMKAGIQRMMADEDVNTNVHVMSFGMMNNNFTGSSNQINPDRASQRKITIRKPVLNEYDNEEDDDDMEESKSAIHNERIPQDQDQQAEGMIDGDDEEGCSQIFTKMHYKVDPKIGLEFINKAIISKQRKVLSYMLKKLGLAIFTGKGINSISLPSNLFEPSTYLVRLAIQFQFAPVFLQKASRVSQPIQQIKYIIAFMLSSMLLTLSMEKPFNPILGETYQASIGDQCDIHLEQICHHPPISAVQCFSRNGDYDCHGHFQYQGSNGTNSLTASKKGFLKIHFKNTNLTYTLKYPQCKISGTMLGKRTFNYSGYLSVICQDAGLQGFITYNPDHKGGLKGLFSKQKTRADSFKGAIINDLKADVTSKKSLQKVNEKCILSQLEGIWTQYLEADGQRIWDINIQKPVKMEQKGEQSLMSDCSRRQDMIEVIKEDFKSAQVWKEKLENLQRADRKARAKFGKIKKKEDKKKMKEAAKEKH